MEPITSELENKLKAIGTGPSTGEPVSDDLYKKLQDIHSGAAGKPSEWNLAKAPEQGTDVFGLEDKLTEIHRQKLREEGGEPGFFKSLGGDIAGGVIEGVETAGRSVRVMNPEEKAGIDEGGLGSRIIKWAQDYKKENPSLEDDPSRTGFSRWFHQGVRSAVQSFAVSAPETAAGAVLGFMSPLPGGALLGGLLGRAAGMAPAYGMAQYDKVVEDYDKKGIDRSISEPIALRQSIYESGTEGLQAGAEAFLFGSSILTKAGTSALRAGVGSLFKESIKKIAGRQLGVLGIETGGEMLASGLEAEEDFNAGVGNQRFFDAAIETFGPALVASFIFGGFAEVGRIKTRQAIKNSLVDPNTNPKDRLAAAKEVYDTIKPSSESVADKWYEAAFKAIKQGESIDLDAPMETDPILDKKIADDHELGRRAAEEAAKQPAAPDPDVDGILQGADDILKTAEFSDFDPVEVLTGRKVALEDIPPATRGATMGPGYLGAGELPGTQAEAIQGIEPQPIVQTPPGQPPIPGPTTEAGPIEPIGPADPAPAPPEVPAAPAGPVTRPAGIDIMQEEYIKGRIAKLGSLEAVNKAYSGTSNVEQYARKLAEETFRGQPAAVAAPQPTGPGITIEAPGEAAAPTAKPVTGPSITPEKPGKFQGTVGFAFVDDQKRAITATREITRGKKKGQFFVTLTNGKIRRVPADAISAFPQAAATPESGSGNLFGIDPHVYGDSMKWENKENRIEYELNAPGTASNPDPEYEAGIRHKGWAQESKKFNDRDEAIKWLNDYDTSKINKESWGPGEQFFREMFGDKFNKKVLSDITSDSEAKVKVAVADAKKNGPSNEFRALFGGIEPQIAGTTPEAVSKLAGELGLKWESPAPGITIETPPAPAAPSPTTPAEREKTARPAWNNATPERREAIARQAGWVTTNGNLTAKGKAVSRSDWNRLSPAAQRIVSDLMPGEQPAAPPTIAQISEKALGNEPALSPEQQAIAPKPITEKPATTAEKPVTKLDADTEAHFQAWLDRVVPVDDQATVEKSMRQVMNDHPDLVKQGKSWSEIRRLAEAQPEAPKPAAATIETRQRELENAQAALAKKPTSAAAHVLVEQAKKRLAAVTTTSEHWQTSTGKIATVDKGPESNWTFYVKDPELKKRGSRVRGHGEKLWFGTKAEAVAALQDYAKGRGWTPVQIAMGGKWEPKTAKTAAPTAAPEPKTEPAPQASTLRPGTEIRLINDEIAAVSNDIRNLRRKNKMDDVNRLFQHKENLIKRRDELQKESRKKPETPRPAKASKITTLRGRIIQMGKINPGNMKGEFKDVGRAVSMLLKKDGQHLDLAEQTLRDEGWLRQDENLVDVLRNPENIRRNKVAGEGVVKREQDKTAQEKQVEKEMAFEPEAPPEGTYVMIDAEDLPEGKKFTLIDDSAFGHDTYEVTEKDAFSITIKDGRTIELTPNQQVQVRREDLPEKAQEKAEEPKAFEKPESKKVERRPKAYIDEIRPIAEKMAVDRRSGFENVLETKLTDAQTTELMIEMLQVMRENGEMALIGDASPTQPESLIKQAWETVSKLKIERPTLVLQGEKAMPKTQAELRTKGRQQKGAQQGGIEFGAAKTERELKIEKLDRDIAHWEQSIKKDKERKATEYKSGIRDMIDADIKRKSAELEDFKAKRENLITAGEKLELKPEPVSAKELEGAKAVKQKFFADGGELEPWQLSRAEFRYSENKPKVDAIQKAIRDGKRIVMTTQYKATQLTKPEHIKIDKNGDVRIQAGNKWPALTDNHVDMLASQAGFELPTRDEQVFHHAAVEEALAAGKPVPSFVLDEYPDLKKKESRDEKAAKVGLKWANSGWELIDNSAEIFKKNGLSEATGKLLSIIGARGEGGANISEVPQELSNQFMNLGNNGLIERKIKDKGVGELIEEGMTAKEASAEIDRYVPTDKGLRILDEASGPSKAERLKGLETSDKIEDFGEKIGGARKDTAERGFKMHKSEKKDDATPSWKKRFVAVESVKEPGKWSIIETKKGDRFGYHGPRQTFSSQEEAEKAIPLYAVAKSFYPTQNEDGTWELTKKVGERKRLEMTQKKFPSREEAMKYMATNAEALLNTKTSFGEEILPVPDTVNRKGAERRTGPATKEMFAETFAPRGIEFGNWNNQEERQLVMDHAYDGLLDLADALGVPPKALMLNGELAIAFGARGQGLSGAKAHYEPDYGVINLTKMKGAGSLAHEWMHVLDHHLARVDTKAESTKVENARGDKVFPEQADKYLFQSHGPSYKSAMRTELKEAYDKLIKTMLKKGEQYVEDTQKADKFVATARENLKGVLDRVRTELQRDLSAFHTHGHRKTAKGLNPASAEQLAEFDRLANILVEGGSLETEFRYNKTDEERTAEGKKRNRSQFGRLMAGRHSNDTLDAISNIYKAVRNRTGFADKYQGPMDNIRQAMGTYSARLKMFEDAQAGTEKTKSVPTNYAIEARKMDQTRVSDYWSEPHEMAARAFASYVEDKIAEKGGQSDFLVYHAHGGIILPMIDGFIARPYPEGKERTAINKAFDEFIKTIKTEETDKGVKMLNVGERAPEGRAIGLQRSNVEHIQGLVPVVEKAMRTAGLPQEVIDRVRVELKPIIDLRGKEADESLRQWAKEGKTMDAILGATTVRKWSALMELSLEQDLNSLEKTTYHEAFHIAAEWMLTPEDRQRLSKFYRTEEGAADAFAGFVSRRSGGQPAPVGAIRRVLLKLKNVLQQVGDFLRGRGITNADEIFGKLMRGEVAPHFARGAGTTTALKTTLAINWGGDLFIGKPKSVKEEVVVSPGLKLSDGTVIQSKEGGSHITTFDGVLEYLQEKGKEKGLSDRDLWKWIDTERQGLEDVFITNANRVVGRAEASKIEKKSREFHSFDIEKPIELTEQAGETKLLLGRKAEPQESVLSEIYPAHVVERVQKAMKGVDRGAILDKIKSGLTEAVKFMTPGREYLHLDPTSFGKAYNILRGFKSTKNYADKTAEGKLREILDPKNMPKRDYEIFTAKIALDDLARELGDGGKYENWEAMVEKFGSLQFGFKSADEVSESLAKADALIEGNATVKDALARREKITGDLLQQVVDADLLPAEVLKDKRYFHHQVLEYLNERYSTGTGAGAFHVGKKGYQRSRIENAKDYSLAYIQSEYEVMAHQLNQLGKKKHMDRMEEAYNVAKELRAQAKHANYVEVVGGQENYDRLVELRADMARVRQDPELDSAARRQLKEWADEVREIDPTMPFRSKMAMGYAQLEKALGITADDEFGNMEGDELNMAEVARLAKSENEAESIPARTILKAMGERNAFIKETLGGRFKTELDLMKDRKPIEGSKGWASWVPNPRSSWFLTGSIADATAQQIMAGSRELQESDIKPVFARGRDESWIIPAELAQTLEGKEFDIRQHDNIISKFSEQTLNMWKRWVLINPMRLVKYNLNNASGDFDITWAYEPRILKEVPQAVRDLVKWHYNREMTPELKKEFDIALEYDGISSGMTATDIPDINNQEGFRNIVEAMSLDKPSAIRYIEKFWQGSKNFTAFRENVLRLASSRWFEKEIKMGHKPYGVSNPAKVDAATDIHEKKWILGRELIGDYGALSPGGQWLRRKLIPFYSWWEINAPRYYRLYKNLAVEGQPEGRRLRMGAVAVKQGAFLSAKVFALYAAAQMFNHLFWPDEEEELGEVGRRQAHLILGRRDDGSIITVRVQGALSDALSWFGLEDFPEDIRELAAGKKSIGKFAAEAALAPVNKFVQGTRPEIKGAGELLTGRTLYPDFTKPRPIRDRAEYVAQMLSAESLYRRAVGRPLRGDSTEERVLSDLLSVFTYSADPQEVAYYKSRDLVNDYLKEHNLERPMADPTNRVNALYYYKQAIKFGDAKAAEKYLNEYKELGGNMKGIQMSVKRAHPLGSLPNKDRAKFFNSLDPEERQTVKRGTEWYRTTYKGGA